MNNRVRISATTDFVKGNGDPKPYVESIAKAGFTHLLWCHEWCTEHLYTEEEMETIAEMLKANNLTLLDIHGSEVYNASWYSHDESSRKAGVELVKNRLKLFHALNGVGTLIMHVPSYKYNSTEEDKKKIDINYASLLKSLDELVPLCEKYKVPLSLENMPFDTFELLEDVFERYPKNLVGLCYDSGHGNIGNEKYLAKGLVNLERNIDRLNSLHLHDNDGTGDQHLPPFMGNIDWGKLVSIIRNSSYHQILSFEISMRECKDKYSDYNEFIKDMYVRCTQVNNL